MKFSTEQGLVNLCLQFLEVKARFWNCYKNVNNIWVLFDN
ncbi:MAG: hypothetical protein ACI9VN_003174, partial [Patescibacteria group bacterium]